MKKLTTFSLTLLLFTVLCFWCDSAHSTNQIAYSSNISSQDTGRDVKIDVVTTTGGKPLPRPRSLQPIIEAELDLLVNQLIVYFNETVGAVTIQVKNSMGQIVTSASCNTKMEPFVIMGISNDSGAYSITIVGSEIEASGYYEIQN